MNLCDNVNNTYYLVAEANQLLFHCRLIVTLAHASALISRQCIKITFMNRRAQHLCKMYRTILYTHTHTDTLTVFTICRPNNWMIRCENVEFIRILFWIYIYMRFSLIKENNKCACRYSIVMLQTEWKNWTPRYVNCSNNKKK